jgi:hypothetical protein
MMAWLTRYTQSVGAVTPGIRLLRIFSETFWKMRRDPLNLDRKHDGLVRGLDSDHIETDPTCYEHLG